MAASPFHERNWGGVVKTYSGKRDKDGTCHVWVTEAGDSHELPPRLDIANHSPTGFEWGYAGSGPAQLALAILVDATGDDRVALRLHQRFKFDRITTLSRSKDWTMSRADVLAFVEAHADKLRDLED